MTVDALYAALMALPITPERLKRAETKADSPTVWRVVLQRITDEGRIPPTGDPHEKALP